MTTLGIREPMVGMTTLGWENVLTQVKTLTRVFEGREAPLLHDSNTSLLLRVDSVFLQGRLHEFNVDYMGILARMSRGYNTHPMYRFLFYSGSKKKDFG